VPGDRNSPDIAKTYPFFSTPDDLAKAGYVEEEYKVSSTATAHSAAGAVLAEGVPYTTRIIVRRPTHQRRFNGTVLVEWQNVTAGYDLDALWNYQATTQEGYTWVGVSAQRVGVQQLAGWSPARYGDLDVTGGGRFTADELSYDIYQQAARALADARRPSPLGGLHVRHLLAIGASQSAGRMTVYYNTVLPRYRPVFDGYAFIVGSAPTRVGPERIMHVLSETDVRTPDRLPDTDHYRRWEVAGAAHSGWNGQEYRAPITARDLPTGTPVYNCDLPPFSRVPLQQVTAAAYGHLVRWIERGTLPPLSPKFEFKADGTKARDANGFAIGGIRLSQVDVPTALNTGVNSGESFCVLFGTYQPYAADQLRALYPSHRDYVDKVTKVDQRNVRAGFIRPADAFANFVAAAHADVPPKAAPPASTTTTSTTTAAP
jgi:hypothetical protein